MSDAKVDKGESVERFRLCNRAAVVPLLVDKKTDDTVCLTGLIQGKKEKYCSGQVLEITGMCKTYKSAAV